jgi:Zn-dependent protease
MTNWRNLMSGHSLVAQRLGIRIHNIALLPIGGSSNLESLPEKPADEIKISVAGPLVSVVLAVFFFAVSLLFGATPRIPSDIFMEIGSLGQFFFYLGFLNITLAVFNLLPAFPLDGGRILRGLLATWLGSARATHIASTIGQVFAAAFFLIGLLSGDIVLTLVAIFIFFGARGEAQSVRERELTGGPIVSDGVDTKPRTDTVTPDHSLSKM